MNKKIHVGSVVGCLMVLIGILVWINGLTMDVKTAFQQTVQWLEYVLGFMLICTGVICNYLGRILDAVRESRTKVNSEQDFNLDVK